MAEQKCTLTVSPRQAVFKDRSGLEYKVYVTDPHQHMCQIVAPENACVLYTDADGLQALATFVCEAT